MENDKERLEAVKEAIIHYEPGDRIVITKTENFLSDMKWLIGKAEIAINSETE